MPTASILFSDELRRNLTPNQVTPKLPFGQLETNLFGLKLVLMLKFLTYSVSKHRKVFRSLTVQGIHNHITVASKPDTRTSQMDKIKIL